MDNNENAEETLRDLHRRAGQALAARRPAEARQLLQRAIELSPEELPLRLNLAAACRLEGDLDGAIAALDQVLKRAPRNFLALLMRASLIEAKGEKQRAAHAYGIALTQLPPLDQLDPATRRAVEHAIRMQAEHAAALEPVLMDELKDGIPGNSAEARRMRGFVEHLLGKRRPYHSEPVQFLYPGLPSVEFLDRDLFPFLPELEAATPRIQEELANAMADPDAAGLEPYIQIPEGQPLDQWAALDHSRQWSAYHFAFYGEPYEEHRRACPFTAALLDRMPYPKVPLRSPASLFSILAAKTHIPPHHGASNTRVLCHLPLVLPEGCRFRCGNETRPWRMGEAFAFDDTIEHEAWNDSDRTRIVLIFDVWNPYLAPAERDLVTRILAALDAFNGVAPDQDI
jgi:aspartate beta-hydroxylase